MLAASLLEWLRELTVQPAAPGLEPKLPLLYRSWHPQPLTLTPVLYRQLVVLLQRQAQYSTDQWVVGALGQFTQILLQLADSSPGWGQNLLGAIGLGSSAAVSVRGKFLARALHLYLR